MKAGVQGEAEASLESGASEGDNLKHRERFEEDPDGALRKRHFGGAATARRSPAACLRARACHAWASRSQEHGRTSRT